MGEELLRSAEYFPGIKYREIQPTLTESIAIQKCIVKNGTSGQVRNFIRAGDSNAEVGGAPPAIHECTEQEQ